MRPLRLNSVAFRLALISGMLIVVAVALLSATFYFGTVGISSRRIDAKILDIGNKLAGDASARDLDALARRIDQALTDGIDSDTEIYYLADAGGHRLAGNIDVNAADIGPRQGIVARDVMRNGRPSSAHLSARRLANGALLVVGRDMSDLDATRDLVWSAIGAGSVLALLFAIGGSLLLRGQIERRIFAIRRTAADIEAGDLSRRIPATGSEDEFTRLAHDINRMLDRIEHLMDGVRHVSNTIAHNLRTPLGRIRGHLDEALRSRHDEAHLAGAAKTTIRQIDDLIVVLQKLLQIAEAESGTRRQPFQSVSLHDAIVDVVELYDAAAEANGIRLTFCADENAKVLGDKDLIGSVLANLLDNAFNYAGPGAHVDVRATAQADAIVLSVADTGPGIAQAERARVLERFYRTQHEVPGSGLGLSIVAAIAYLHGATLRLDDAAPGLCVRIAFPPIDKATFPNGNDLSISSKGGNS